MFNSGERFEEFRGSIPQGGTRMAGKGITIHEPKEAKAGAKIGQLKPSQHFGSKHAGGKSHGRKSSRH
jgi:hypothetical protein